MIADVFGSHVEPRIHDLEWTVDSTEWTIEKFEHFPIWRIFYQQLDDEAQSFLKIGPRPHNNEGSEELEPVSTVKQNI